MRLLSASPVLRLPAAANSRQEKTAETGRDGGEDDSATMFQGEWSLVRAQHGEPSWGDEIEPPPKTLDFSRVFRVFRGNFIPLSFLHPFLDL